ncbi:MAG: DciA family protein [Actinobacteria bacterium]|nr:DciA family protein [Actinomycetota bacterium]MDA2981393.1 DciA family protein [Actinomycetota bacterium]MDA2996220.1 DciA family protein [Actinomycetota bacterium]
MARDLARELYRAFRNQSRRNRASGPNNEAQPREQIGDPQQISFALNELINTRDWRQGLAEGNIFSDWEKIVGSEIAAHSLPISIVDGRLTIQTSSTAWATQLNIISTELLKTIRGSAPGALVETLVFIGPNAPSWKKGLRTIRGARGPRDTYG